MLGLHLFIIRKKTISKQLKISLSFLRNYFFTCRHLATTSLPHTIRHVGEPAYALAIIHSARMAKETTQKGSIPGYASIIADAECKQRYAEKLKLINYHDPYELPKEEWKDNLVTTNTQ